MQRFQEETARYLYLMQILERPSGRAACPVKMVWHPAMAVVPVAERPTRACLCFVQAEAAETTARLVLSQPQSTNSKNPSSAKNAANWIKHAWRDPAILSRFSR